MKNILGIECSVAISDSQSHLWNYINIDGKWYHVDLTADDPSFVYYGGEKYDGFGEVSHDNFLLSDTQCKKTTSLHEKWDVFGLPRAGSTKYDNFFWKGCYSAVFKYEGLWYYAVVDPLCSALNYKDGKDHEIVTLICAYDPKSRKSKVLSRVESTWYLYRDQETGEKLKNPSWYRRSFLKLALLNGDLFYNTADSVYCIRLKTEKEIKVYSFNKRDMSIYAVTVLSENKLRICYKQDMSYGDRYINLIVKS